MANRVNVDEIVELEPRAIENFLRVVQRITPEEAKGVMSAAAVHLSRLGVTPDPTKAYKRPFDGSLSIDIGSMVTWMEKIQPIHRRAIDQLQAIWATASARCTQ